MDSWLLSLLKEGGTVAVAAVSLWMLNRVWNERLLEAKRNNEALQLLTAQLQKAIEENTRVIAVFLERTRPLDESESSNGYHTRRKVKEG
jgi:hypothetical protein